VAIVGRIHCHPVEFYRIKAARRFAEENIFQYLIHILKKEA
jgi:hypothetical protein